MSEQNADTLRCNPSDLRQAMSIHTRKITDSCRDKDCIEDLRVYLTTGSQQILDSASNARVRSAELLYTYIDVEPVAFDGHHYCIDVTFYYRVLPSRNPVRSGGLLQAGCPLRRRQPGPHLPQRHPHRRPRRHYPQCRQSAHRSGGGPGPHGTQF